MYRIDLRYRGPLFERQDVRERFDREISAELVELSSIGQRLVVSETPRGATGQGRGSIITELRGRPGRREGVVATSVFYLPIVERGRRPGRRPPVQALVLWVVRKLGITDEKRARSVAFLIARKIGRRGTEPASMFLKAARRLQPIAQQRWQALGARLARQLGGR
jgi:hypothetical protein